MIHEVLKALYELILLNESSNIIVWPTFWSRDIRLAMLSVWILERWIPNLRFLGLFWGDEVATL